MEDRADCPESSLEPHFAMTPAANRNSIAWTRHGTSRPNNCSYSLVSFMPPLYLFPSEFSPQNPRRTERRSDSDGGSGVRDS